ncbi:uncharacterized protein LOC110881378 [Helianthus annuus]|uniref:uncharacterized protein LOC110881378 n=1 Tax=Helianthus annuus TaxID=4232 RepID=UPI000B8F7694|nr:uncharacterized protein LOC110881378 [Helianthus annuus]
MAQMNFSSKWRGWVMSIIRNSRASVLVNGSPSCEFSCQRGLRPGDPLSPFLFILAMDGLTRIMRRACELGVFHGIRVGGTGPLISHFMYADDVVFCGEWSIANAINLRRLLRGFFLISWLKISSKKSSVFGIGVGECDIVDMARLLKCSRGRFPFTHLGVPIASNMNLVRSWDPVLEKFQKRLSAWKSKCLSYGGRITLLKSILSSLPLYFFSLFRAPIQVINTLRKLRRKVFWGGVEAVDRMSWLAWDKVVAPTKYGGVGLGSLRDANLSLLSKWWWRFKVSQDSLWRKVIWSIHGSGRGWTYIPVKLTLGGMWKQIASVPDILENISSGPNLFVNGNVKSGHSVFFWSDWWVSDNTLQRKFPLLFALEKKRCCLVSDRLLLSAEQLQFAWDWKRSSFTAAEQIQYDALISLVSNVNLSPGVDSWTWSAGGEIGFSVRNVKE